MFKSILSGDTPGRPLLSVAIAAIVLCLAFAPFIFPGTRSMDTAARICIIIALVASYDLLLGYTGIVSFAHTMFFGLGAYGVAIASYNFGPGWGSIGLGTLIGVAIAAVLALFIALASLRVRAIFFAMITLAVSSAFGILISQLYTITGGEDGLTYRVPHILTPAFKLADFRIFDVRLDGRLLAYYLVFVGATALFLLLMRFVNSPFGRVLQAIRENDFRAEALGFKTVYYRTIASVISAVAAALVGALFAVWLRYTGPETTLSLDLMIDILVMVVIGGMGTMWGAILGATIFVLAQNYLRDVMATASAATADIPFVPDLLHPDRWLFWLGLLFILSVYFFPTGIVGRFRGKFE
ncbi:branched-chain amino acid ABC transporter permease [Pelagibacterium flavum]|uniref:Branched-chain amino acid ABC transporter permease n=1 Tax=Pelagibacterium flavum TaxID=2984530 RepID=A0ABY6IJC5_9HYPH|nr:branched-chain amino acid ABC transporter permease [Pelagibacterium sp. YIM 151497]MAN78518.1 branched-chain amino acid ABC transporter permease [Hyphomicrobiales bacterium]UYQ70701.1 branched-chain amino acid ABC transporter permease [Pelagibacterium sp. YIM 151497]|tara:strand:- start:2505 stop:3566 length:1062 start_codon:yes stop_codon:yes gene_type:complete